MGYIDDLKFGMLQMRENETAQKFWWDCAFMMLRTFEGTLLQTVLENSFSA